MNTVKLTIVMATHNGALYLEEQLDSILNQTFTNYKILISDDASTDGTWMILNAYREKYDSIEIFQNKIALGVVKNFESLIEKVTTPYISLCDQDDIWHKNKLEKAMKLIAKENINTPCMIHSDLKVVDKKLNLLNKSFFKMRGYAFPLEQSIDILIGRSGVMGNTILFNQALKEKILPFPKNLIVHDYWIALVNEIFGKRITINEPLVTYRLHSNNTSSHLRKKIKSNKRFIILPYQNIERESVLKQFLERFHLREKERIIFNDFIDYLEFRKNKKKFLKFIFKYNFFRIGIKYKIKLIGAILYKKV